MAIQKIDVDLHFDIINSKSGTKFEIDLPPALVRDALENAVNRVAQNAHNTAKADDPKSWGDHDNLKDAADAMMEARLDAWRKGVWSQSGGGGARLDADTLAMRDALTAYATGPANMTATDAQTLYKGRKLADYWQVARVLVMRAKGITDPDDERVAEPAMRALMESKGAFGKKAARFKALRAAEDDIEI